MDVLDTLVVRFHIKGEFVTEGREKKYVDDDDSESDADMEVESDKESEEAVEVDVAQCKATAAQCDQTNASGLKGKSVMEGDEDDRMLVVYYPESAPLASLAPSESESDSDYIPGDVCPSDDDEEAAEIEKHYKEVKKKIKTGQLEDLDAVFFEQDRSKPIEELGSDGEVRIRQDKHPRYKKKDGVPTFELGMKFNCKNQFKKAITKYALAEKKVINFIKDDQKRVRGKCDWDTCQWVCLLSKNSRSDSWQIVTYESLHACPPRRDNKMVTATRIAQKYWKFIAANPS
ncbi:hypothetical protein OsJ_10318 [Oryza sativa Japonica Group]|uniref:Transposase MuDR plant domain-containing protein n=1 Tax=Oryza sativa subsp. japonica TaxID=39947 RepID=B9F7A6_ORYSJ|nr:hypothetical protein OsJ_10318 [Oryza sativa Japonica Group]